MTHAVTAGMPAADMAVTVPAHWRPSVVDTLRRTIARRVPVVSDATAALTALSANPGLPTRGVIVLCDFGGSGTSITLANASANYAVVGETVRFTDFSGDHIDQALLTHVVSGLDASHADPSGTAMVGSLTSAARRMPARQGAAVRRDRHAPSRSTCPGIAPTSASPAPNSRTCIAGAVRGFPCRAGRYARALRRSVGRRLGGRHRRRWCPHPVDHPAALRAPARTGGDHAASATHRGRGRGPDRTAQSRRRDGDDDRRPPRSRAVRGRCRVDAGPPSTTFGALAWSDDDGGEDVLPYAEAAMDTEYHRAAGRLPPRASLPARGVARRRPRAPCPARPVRRCRPCRRADHRRGVRLHAAAATPTTPVDAATTMSRTSPAPAAPVPSPPPPAPQAPPVTTVVVHAHRTKPRTDSRGASSRRRIRRPTPRHLRRHDPADDLDDPPTSTPPTTDAPDVDTADMTPPWQPPPVDPGPGDGATDPAHSPPLTPAPATAKRHGTPADPTGDQPAELPEARAPTRAEGAAT